MVFQKRFCGVGLLNWLLAIIGVAGMVFVNGMWFCFCVFWLEDQAFNILTKGGV